MGSRNFFFDTVLESVFSAAFTENKKSKRLTKVPSSKSGLSFACSGFFSSGPRYKSFFNGITSISA
jgi:hypothetical protein